MCASTEDLVDCGNSDMDNTTKFLALPMATSMSSISSNCASSFRGNDSLKCSKICFSDRYYVMFVVIKFHVIPVCALLTKSLTEK